MTLALLDLQEQSWHAIEVMLGIFQPALWLLLCIGFVLASAHLLTMFGTRWGDRRVSPKALIFSLAVHVSLAVALLSMVKDVRRHMLSLDDESSEPLTVDINTLDDSYTRPQMPDGNTPIWERIPEQIRQQFTRQSPPESLPLPNNSASPRPSPIQLAMRQFPETVRLPDSPQVDPAPIERPQETQNTRPVESPLKVMTPETESRPDAVVPSPKVDRSPTPTPIEEPSPVIAKPDGGAPDRLTPTPDPTEALASITAAPDPTAPLRRTDPQDSIDRRESPSPANVEMPVVGAEGDTMIENAAPGPPKVQRQRTTIASNSFPQPEPVERFRPEVTPAPVRPPMVTTPPSPLGRPMTESMPSPARPDPLGPPGAEQLASIDRQQVPAAFRMRTQQDQKDEAIRKYGGTEDTQKAVERALAWLAGVQERDGSYNPRQFDAGQGPPEDDSSIADRRYAGAKADTGITALVVLAMLGNGNSLSSGPYSVNVESAIEWLIRQQRIDGYLGGDASQFSGMYCHGMATLALAEAYGMESDPVAKQRIRSPLEKALSFTRFAQLQDGGWRYLPGQPDGDMSMFGWQLMALRSAQDAGIPIPEETKDGMIQFLRDRSRGTAGGLAGYRRSSPTSPTMTAEALACKQMLGLKRDNPVATEAVRYLLRNTPRQSELNLYYWYYGTFAMFQHGGDLWEQWNLPLRQILVSEQEMSGDLLGSWNPRGPYGGYGGRLYSTALAALCLEVYYRRLPMYRWTGETESAE